MRTIYADTYFFLAQLNCTDEANSKATAFMASFSGRLLTTDWVLVELGDAFCRPPNRDRFVNFYRQLPGMSDLSIVSADRRSLEEGFALFAAASVVIATALLAGAFLNLMTLSIAVGLPHYRIVAVALNVLGTLAFMTHLLLHVSTP